MGTFTSVNELRLCGSPAQTCRWRRQAGFQIPNGQELDAFPLLGRLDSEPHRESLGPERTELVLDPLSNSDGEDGTILEKTCVGVVLQRVKPETMVRRGLDPGLGIVPAVDHLSVASWSAAENQRCQPIRSLDQFPALHRSPL